MLLSIGMIKAERTHERDGSMECQSHFSSICYWKIYRLRLFFPARLEVRTAVSHSVTGGVCFERYILRDGHH